MKIFVFGSNLAGIHRAGSALAAKERWGAIEGCGVGIQGNSYAIPTKDTNLRKLPLNIIKGYIDEFIEYAQNHLQDTFYIVDIGCGLAKFLPEQIAPMFINSPQNCIFSDRFKRTMITKRDSV